MTSCRSPQTAHYGKPYDRNSHFGRHVVACLCGRSDTRGRSVLPRLSQEGTKSEAGNKVSEDKNPKTSPLTWEERGVHTKDIYEHVAAKLNAFSKILEAEKNVREEAELKATAKEESNQREEVEKKYRQGQDLDYYLG